MENIHKWRSWTRDDWLEGTDFLKTFPWRLKKTVCFLPGNHSAAMTQSSLASQLSGWLLRSPIEPASLTTQKMWLDMNFLCSLTFSEKEIHLEGMSGELQSWAEKDPRASTSPSIKMLRIRTEDVVQRRSMNVTCPGPWVPTSAPGVGEIRIKYSNTASWDGVCL